MNLCNLNLEEIPPPPPIPTEEDAPLPVVVSLTTPVPIINPINPKKTKEKIKRSRLKRTRLKKKIQRKINKPSAEVRNKINIGNRPQPRPTFRGVR